MNGCTQTLSMPLHAPCARPSCTEKYSVRVMPLGTNSFWMHKDDIPWFVNYVTDEVQKGGVAVEEEDGDVGTAVAEPNCRVPGVHIQWSFHTSAWEAVFLQGSHKGYKFALAVTALDKNKWDKVAFLNPHAVTLQKSNFEQRKAASWHYVELHCQALMDKYITPTAYQSQMPYKQGDIGGNDVD